MKAMMKSMARPAKEPIAIPTIAPVAMPPLLPPLLLAPAVGCVAGGLGSVMGGGGGIACIVATLNKVRLALIDMLVREPAKTTKLESAPTEVGLAI